MMSVNASPASVSFQVLEARANTQRTLWPNICEDDAAALDELQCFVDVLGLLDTHTWVEIVPAERGLRHDFLRAAHERVTEALACDVHGGGSGVWVNERRRTMSWHSRTPSLRSVPRFFIAGMLAGSKRVLSLCRQG